MKNLSWRAYTTIGVIIVAIIYLIPSINPKWWPHKTINRGLDLQGGMHLVLEVDTPKAVENAIERLSGDLKDAFKRKKISYLGVTLPNPTTIALKVRGDESIKKFQTLLEEEFSGLRIVSSEEKDNILSMTLDLPDAEAANLKKMATEQALETIRNRIDEFGVSEPDIRMQGENRILVQLPGVKNPARAKNLIGKTALLEFKLVDEEHDVQKALKGDVPQGSEILYEIRTDPMTHQTRRTPYLIKKRTSLTGRYLVDARVHFESQFNTPYVGIKFDKKGAKIFSRITGENVKKRLAIVLDHKVYSAPVIQDKISGGSAQITGSFTQDQAHDLAIVLRAGALPAPVKVIEERTVGPSLGDDSIHKGKLSMIVGGVIVVIFMAFYYGLSGFLADIALILNVILIGAGLAAFQATLTLPGIAGIILTIGMAVDANVLIFERIREELRLGKTVHASVTAGFERATLTILDANVTTLIAAVVLFQFGTGPVKGFAVTLSLGILSSMFTALILLRLIFDSMITHYKVKTLSI